MDENDSTTNDNDDQQQQLNEDDYEEELELDDNDQPPQAGISDDEDEAGHDLDDENQYGLEDAENMIEDGSMLTFRSHKQPVFCCDLVTITVNNGNSITLAITGGQDDIALVWRVNDGEPLFQCSGHMDSVICVAFNCNGKYAVSGDMKGLLQVWQVENGACILQQELEEIQWCRWHPQSPAVLLVGTDDGSCWLFKVDDASKIRTLMGGSSAVAGEFLPDLKRAVVGYEDGSIRVWDLATCNSLHTIKPHQGDEQPTICAIAVRSDGTFAFGTISGRVRVANSNTYKISCDFECGKQQSSNGQLSSQNDDYMQAQSDNSVEAMVFCESLPILVTGCVNGTIECWDVDKQILRNQIRSEGGISKLRLSRQNPFMLFVAGLDGVMRAFDICDGRLLKEYLGHSREILDFALSHDGQQLLTTSEDSTSKLFAV